MRALAAGAFLLIDALIGAGALIAAIVIVTGGGVMTVSGHRVSVHSIGNLLLVMSVLGALRLTIGAPYPLAGRWPVAGAGAKSLRLISARQAKLRDISARDAAAICLSAAAFALMLKLGNAYFHFGFFSGDDVEIHEMTFAAIFHWKWTAWYLRSAFYPMVFIYPVQRTLVALGVSSPAALIFAGRAVVAAASTVGVLLIFRVARSMCGLRIAVLAAVIFSMSGLVAAFGGTELPRPIGAVFVLAAFGALQSRRGAWIAAGGISLAIAAAMRFSEVIFVVPAALQLLFERRHTQLAGFVVVFGVTAAAIQASADYLYWGTPFQSVVNAFDFTVVHKLSSRGTEPFWEYLAHIPSWSDFVIVGLAAVGTARGGWREAMWAWIPLAVLSCLPHKEPRYLIPIIPFVSLLAARGLGDLVDRLDRVSAAISAREAQRAGIAALALVALCAASAMFQLSQARFRKSEDDVRLATAIAAAGDRGGIAGEQIWRLGGRLYLGAGRDVINLEAEDFDTADRLAAAIAGRPVDEVVVFRSTCARRPCDPLMAGIGLRRTPRGNETYILYTR